VDDCYGQPLIKLKLVCLAGAMYTKVIRLYFGFVIVKKCLDEMCSVGKNIGKHWSIQ